MITKPFSAFGYVAIQNDVEAGEVVIDDTLSQNCFTYDETFQTIWLQTTGQVECTNESGEVQLRVAGDSTLSKPPLPGKNLLTFKTPTTTFCISPSANRDRRPVVPSLQHFAVAAGETATLPQGSRLFLAAGILSVGGLQITGTRQIGVNSGEKTCVAVTDCLGFLFQ